MTVSHTATLRTTCQRTSTRSSPRIANFRRRPRSGAARTSHDTSIYAARRQGPRRLLGGAGRTSWSGSRSGIQVLDWKPPHATVVHRRKAQRLRQLRRPPHQDGAAQQGRADLGRRARRPADAHLLGSLRRSAEVRERPQEARREARRSRGDLHAAHSRSRDRDARLHAHRRHPLRGVRRLLARIAARPHQRRESARCSSPPTAAIGAARSCRSSETADKALEECPIDRARRRRAAARRRDRRRSVRRR